MSHRIRPTRLLARLVATVLAGSAALLVVQAWWAPAAAAQADEPLPAMAFVVNAFDFPDALAASAAAGSLGAPVILTPGGGLDANADRALATANPDVVVVVGGTAVISQTVVDDIAAQGYAVQRVAGATRTATAAELVDFADEHGYGRPVVTGREVAAGTVPGLDAELLRGLAPDELGDSDRFEAIEARLDALETENAELQATLAGVTRSDVDGRDTLRLSGMNVQVVNGTDTTDGVPNGLGNLIVGYNEDFTCSPLDFDCPVFSDFGPDERTGSHMVVTGIDHTYTTFGGLLAGADNATSGDGATVTGGRGNTASGPFASVAGGENNTASGAGASVGGGLSNTASSLNASVSGGTTNTASSTYASVTGGNSNTASGFSASVSGGRGNTAADRWTTVAGGRDGVITDDGSTDASGNDYDSLIADTPYDDS